MEEMGTVREREGTLRRENKNEHEITTMVSDREEKKREVLSESQRASAKKEMDGDKNDGGWKHERGLPPYICTPVTTFRHKLWAYSEVTSMTSPQF